MSGLKGDEMVKCLRWGNERRLIEELEAKPLSSRDVRVREVF